jgi:hypothetical protein
LSSLPHLSLSSITGDNSRPQQNQQQNNQNFDVTRPLNPVHGSAPSQILKSTEISPKAHEYSSEPSGLITFGDFNTNKLNSPIAKNQQEPHQQSLQPPLQPPPVAVGGGNNQILK